MITRIDYGHIKGKAVAAYVLRGDGIEATVTEYGAAVTSIVIFTPRGGIETTVGYEKFDCDDPKPRHLGATVGRVANRIANGEFVLFGKRYVLEKNKGNCCSHGGNDGLDNRIYDSAIVDGGVEFYLLSPDGDCGFPGDLRLKIRYTIEGRALKAEYTAVSDKDTIWAPTNHAYFNLSGGPREIYDTLLTINAKRYTPAVGGIPTGEIKSVVGTPFDFLCGKKIGADIHSDAAELKDVGGGYDHNYVLDGEHAATAFYSETGITLDVFTDMPGLQFYTANSFNFQTKARGLFGRHSAFCLEPQFFPNAINTDGFKKPVIRAGETATHYIKFAFSVK